MFTLFEIKEHTEKARDIPTEEALACEQKT
jgi:hypothetical protein